MDIDEIKESYKFNRLKVVIINRLANSKITKEVVVKDITALNSGYFIIEYLTSDEEVKRLLVNNKCIGYPNDDEIVHFEMDYRSNLENFVPKSLSPSERECWVSGYRVHQILVAQKLSNDSVSKMINKFRESFNNPVMCNNSILDSFIKGIHTVKEELSND